MKNLFYMAAVLAAVLATGCCRTPAAGGRWSVEKAEEWYAGQDWPVGCNYVASYAINQFEMWQEETYNPEVLDREMGYAQGLGFNTVRVFLHDVLYDVDPEGFLSRVDDFLGICEKHGIKVIVTFFTNGGSYGKHKPGPQPEAVQGVHNSQWIQSPGAPVVNDPAQWPRLEKYVKAVVGKFADDSRVLAWCLYNEPENLRGGAESLGLLRAVFAWAREVNPTQPLTSPIWIRPGQKGPGTKLDIVSFLGENCDIMSFHCYYDTEMADFITMMKRFGRPMICTEYMGRPNSTFAVSMPLLKADKVGAISWGLTSGKCHFHLQWTSKAGDPEPEIWFHDIMREDGTPYSQEEVDFIRSMTKKD